LTRLKQKVTETEAAESIEEEEGFLDLIETANDSITKVYEVLTRMTKATQDLGEKLQERTEEANKLAAPNGSPNLKVAKRVAANAARDFGDFVSRMNVEIPLFSNFFSTAMDSFGRASVLSTDFGTDNTDDLQDVLDNIVGYRTAMTDSRSQIGEFRNAVSKMPRMTTVLNRARREALATVDKLLIELNSGERQLSDVEILLSGLIEQYKKTEDG
jgi:hypothetical protein